MNLLLTGPAASPLTRAAVERFQSLPGSLLLLPTATMAEHIKHSLARAGVAVRPKSILTLAGFLDAWAPQAAAPAALVHLLMEQALERLRPARFREVAEFPGVIQALAELFAEVSGTRLPDDVGRLFAEVEKELAGRGMAARHARLGAAVKRIALGDAAVAAHVVLCGFFKLSAEESALVAVLSRRSEMTVALPEWPGAERAREGLLAGGFEVRQVEARASSARTSLFCASTLEREVEEIARRILAEAGKGRAFREMGVVLRSRDPYGPLVETTLARFGIPARSYFIDPVASHAAVDYRCRMVRAMLAGWDHEALLRALRMPVSGMGATAAGDELDFEIRAKLPDRGLPVAGLDLLPAWMTRWNARERAEAVEWSARLRELRRLTAEPVVTDGADWEQIQAWRSTAAALRAFDGALEQTAEALQGAGRISLDAFWEHVETVLWLEPLRVPDARRDVVHILDAYEARQWSLPIVFVCGLTERHFPKYHREDAIVGDAARRRAGLDTAADYEREERFLFDLATSRATVETVLSYPRYDAGGEEMLRSFYLAGSLGAEVAGRVRPAPAREIVAARAAPIQDTALLERLSVAHKMLSASSVDSYLQCPFQFFSRKTLRLRERPKVPRDRLDALLQGSILHHALAEWARMPLLGTAVLEQVFEEECAKAHVPRTYRKEAVRLELMRHFSGFIQDTQVSMPGWTQRVEESFTIALHGSLALRGRVDRMDVSPDNRALVIDYKYSPSGTLRDKIAGSVAGDFVQAGVYLLAAERAFGLRPAGMLFCHMKKGVAWDGWHHGVAGLEPGERRTEEAFAELANNAEQTVLRVHQEITSGRIEARPSDDSKCVWCECRDMCRVESIGRAREAAGS
ncbi:MAG: PD-(D/E)XK nuclease family protein [Acidobacteriota bacterium]